MVNASEKPSSTSAAKAARSYVEISAAPFPGPHGGAVAGFRDVTEEIHLRSEQSERAAQFKALLDHLPVGVAYFDEHGICRAANGATRRLLAPLARSHHWRPRHRRSSRYAPALHEGLARCLEERQPQSEHSAPWPDPSSPGGARYLDWRFEPLPTTSGFFLGALALIVDVTDRKHSADQLRLAAEAAVQASRNKTQFLSAVSHDLRTPANALSLLADCLDHASHSGGPNALSSWPPWSATSNVRPAAWSNSSMTCSTSPSSSRVSLRTTPPSSRWVSGSTIS